MSLQLGLFEYCPASGVVPRPATAGQTPPRARRNDPATSKLAAAAATDLAGHHEAKIRAAIHPGEELTIYELAERTKLDHVQVARRLPAMSDFKRTENTKPGKTGRPCGCWTLI